MEPPLWSSISLWAPTFRWEYPHPAPPRVPWLLLNSKKYNNYSKQCDDDANRCANICILPSAGQRQCWQKTVFLMLGFLCKVVSTKPFSSYPTSPKNVSLLKPPAHGTTSDTYLDPHRSKKSIHKPSLALVLDLPWFCSSRPSHSTYLSKFG